MIKNKSQWTIIVYLAGDNNLTTECLFALNEMKKAVNGPNIKVIAQFDPCDNYLPTHRYEINRKGPGSSLFDDLIDEATFDFDTHEVSFHRESKTARDLARVRQISRRYRLAPDNSIFVGEPDEDEVVTDDTDTGSPITLYNFISFCVERYPADHYMVVLSGHAGGTERDYLLKDESSSRSLTFNELKHVFEQIKQDRNGKSIDILGMDNCLMSMGEICYELRGLVEILVGCESYSPASGWPYREILERLNADLTKPKRSVEKSVPSEIAKGIVEEYVNYYADYWLSGLSVTQSAIDLNQIEKLKELVDKLVDELERKLVQSSKKSARQSRTFSDELVMSHWESQSFNGEQFVDLYDFCDRLEHRVTEKNIRDSCRALKHFITSKLVLKSCYSGATYQYSYGLSLYFPWAQVASAYENLDFIKNTVGNGWASFLHTYVLLTRRAPRGVDRGSALSAISAGLPSNSRMSSDRMSSDRMSSDRMSSDRMSSDRMSSDRVSGNPVHSMRNPPVVFFPTDCMRDRKHIVATQERLLSNNR